MRTLVRAVEPEPESVPRHQRLGWIIGRSDLLEAEAEALQELDRPVERIRGNPDCSMRVVGVHDLVQRAARNARSFRSMKARSSGLAPAPAGWPQSDGSARPSPISQS